MSANAESESPARTLDTTAGAEQAELRGLYGDSFYKGQVEPSLESARILLRHLWSYFQANSVVDVGCGRGSWLVACRELGSTRLIGLDGDWNSQATMIDQTIEFRPTDLNEPFSLGERVDLAITVETAEHLKPRSSKPFVESLTKAADAVVFGAAYVGQGGVNHLNERQHSSWAAMFLERGYAPFDVFRPRVWGDDRVRFWYRQNTFLYVRKGSAAYGKLEAAGLHAMPDISFTDCIHPMVYAGKLASGISFRGHVRGIIPSLVRAVRRRVIGDRPSGRNGEKA